MKKLQSLKRIKRIVIKVGSSTLIRRTGKLNLSNMERIIRIISDLHNQGIEVVLVSSGAIRFGAGKMGLKEKPEKIEEKQALASIGQGLLMHMYEKLFFEYGITVGQLLLTRGDLEEKNRRDNARNTFETLFKYRAIPIVNENDTVAVEEIVYGDNDTLSAVVAILINADLLVILSDIDGLYTGDPRKNDEVRKIPVVENITEEIENIAMGAGDSFGIGGMKTKISAAKMATEHGIFVSIIEGERPEQIRDLINGKYVGTIFLPTNTRRDISGNFKSHWAKGKKSIL